MITVMMMIWYSKEGPGRGRSPHSPSSLYQM